MSIWRRVPVLVVLALVLGLMALAGPGSPTGGGLAVEAAADVAMPVADAAGVLSSTWYCAAGSADGGVGDLAVIVANPLDDARRGTVTWFADGERRSDPIQVGARESLVLAAADTVDGPQASAVVEIEGGGVAVEHRLAGEGGSTTAPCASAPSNEWHLANGSTARDAEQRFYLFNPFPDDAIVDVTFAGPDGLPQSPPDLQGLAVPPQTTTVIDVGEHARRLDTTAATVTTRSGRLVVDRLQRFTGEAGRTGISLAVAAPGPALDWHFGLGNRAADLTQRWHVYNPGEAEAIVVLEVTPDGGPVPEPVERTVRGGTSLVLSADDLPLDEASGFASSIRSINDVPVVAEREVDARDPERRQGWTSTLGSPLTARRWLVPSGMESEAVAQSIIVSNPTAEAVVVSVVVVSGGSRVGVPDAEAIELGPAERAGVSVGEGSGGPLAVLVEADGPVTVERNLYWRGGTVIDVSTGIPLR